MSQESRPSIPLLGALCVTEGLVSQVQLDACLQLQMHCPTTPIGHILCQHGYLSEVTLARMVAQQNAFRRTLLQGVERQLRALQSDATLGQMPHSCSDTPIAGSICELAAFVTTEIDQSQLFSADA